MMFEFFQEISDYITDPRKKQITLRHLLQMRAGYPWEESHPDLWKGLLSGHLQGEGPCREEVGNECLQKLATMKARATDELGQRRVKSYVGNEESMNHVYLV